jgi:hypothetical protein
MIVQLVWLDLDLIVIVEIYRVNQHLEFTDLNKE